ncbi:23S rRNA (adenine(2030)-N(6))-methyltransferase RlmJ [Lamprocystis purpurea]|jgi:23S rRNA (adenine2030-N6)-methyltransferase|uniref:23S rRNA (adenine(2030)-N(6))-methyltransferase RlmJ n=1 Tax=Lamprocystis purpurea TaxID=61598 RepID=UPI000362E33C|nr:23S rRNA (adenine(2030)-N(6))-methyltransferase RlmJ [Lamprocystis purpurea]
MLGYRHAFHAGNFADVFKHALLVQLVLALRTKDKPFCVIDTHAGAGAYDLAADSALKNGEFDGGIGRLWGDGGAASSPDLAAYLDLVRALNPDGALRWYPGSPRLAHALLRSADRLILCERHPSDHQILHAEFAGDPQVAVHLRDGYEAPRALMPPPQRRGLVLMDPSFELAGEFARLTAAVTTIRRRWAGAVVAIWYPIIEREPSLEFLRQLKGLGIPGILVAELGLLPYRGTRGLHGSGMVIVNPPWGIDLILRRLVPALRDRLRVEGPGETRVEWLVPMP